MSEARRKFAESIECNAAYDAAMGVRAAQLQEEAYAAGVDYAKHGANGENSHFRHFATRKLKAAWELGRDSQGRRPGEKEGR